MNDCAPGDDDPKHALTMERPVLLGLHHAEQVESILIPWRRELQERCVSDFYFSNIYLFRHVHAYRLSVKPQPCLCGLTYDGKAHLFPLFKLSDVSVAELRSIIKGDEFFYPVSEQVASALDTGIFRIEWNDADADYLYPADNFRYYKGSLLRKKKSLMRQLLDVASPEVRALSRINRGDALEILAQWGKSKALLPGGADEGACREALMRFDELSLNGLIYYFGETPIGFLMYQETSHRSSIIRFAKGVEAFKGIYQYMFHNYCMSNPALDWINFEQDMGLSNFRQTKKSYQPEAFLKKYRVSLHRLNN